MKKSFGIEYLIIVAAIAATLSVPLFASSILAATTSDSDIQADSPTVKSLGTVSTSDVTGVTQQKGFAGANQANASDEPFQVMHVGDITYITGGIGDEERQELESTKQNYNLHITSAGNGGEYMGNTRVAIRDTHGNELLNIPTGPIFYAQLPAGTYTIEAHSNGQTQQRKVTAGRNTSSLHFSWK